MSFTTRNIILKEETMPLAPNNSTTTKTATNTERGARCIGSELLQAHEFRAT